MLRTVNNFRMILWWCLVKRRIIALMFWFSYNYKCDVNNLGSLIGSRTKTQRKESCPEHVLKLFSKIIEHLYKTVAQNCCLNWEIFTFKKFVVLPFVLFPNFVHQFVPYCYKFNSLVKANIVSTQNKRQQHWRLLCQLDHSDEDVIVGDAAKNGH